MERPKLTVSRHLVLCYIYWCGLYGNGIISVSVVLPVPQGVPNSVSLGPQLRTGDILKSMGGRSL